MSILGFKCFLYLEYQRIDDLASPELDLIVPRSDVPSPRSFLDGGALELQLPSLDEGNLVVNPDPICDPVKGRSQSQDDAAARGGGVRLRPPLPQRYVPAVPNPRPVQKPGVHPVEEDASAGLVNA
jgi:hypothetical protein